MKSRRKGLSEVVGITIVTSVVVVIGIGLWYFLASYTSITRSGEVVSVGGQALLLRSNIGADYVFYPDQIYGAGIGSIMIRNVGREPVVVFRLITISNGTVVADTGISELARLPVGETKRFSFTCPVERCPENAVVTVQVHYIPEKLFNPNDPRLKQHYSETELYKIASFKAQPSLTGMGRACTLETPNWILVELIDPKEDTIYGHSTDFIKIRVLNASIVRPSYGLRVLVTDGLGVVATGTVYVSGMLPQEVYVRLDRGGLTPPFQVSITSLDPGFTVIPINWNFPNSFGNFIDYSKLRIDLTRFTLDEVILSMGFYESGDYEMIVEIYDCNGRLATTGSIRVNITVGSLAGYFEQFSIVLRPPISIFDIGAIVIRSVDRTPYVTVTTTIYQTQTVFSTTTRTFSRTATVTTTITTTRTTTTATARPSTTTTVTRTTTRTSTVTSFTPTTITRTTTSITRTFTTTLSRTSTLTATSRSPTITLTSSTTVTSYTSTRTSTSTSTNWVTATVTTTTTTTTTVTGGRSNEFQLVALDRSPFWSLWWLYYLVAASLLPVPLRRFLRGGD